MANADIDVKQEDQRWFQDAETIFLDHLYDSVAWGVAAAGATEETESWKAWRDGLGLVPAVSGDADWGKLAVQDYCYSPVRKVSSGGKRITITCNKYGTGGTPSVVEVRGGVDPFYYLDATPAWQAYAGPIYNTTWEYVQVRVKE